MKTPTKSTSSSSDKRLTPYTPSKIDAEKKNITSVSPSTKKLKITAVELTVLESANRKLAIEIVNGYSM